MDVGVPYLRLWVWLGALNKQNHKDRLVKSIWSWAYVLALFL